MGAAGFVIDDLMRIQIAAQACILILELDVDYYDGWREIIVYPGQFAKTHDTLDEFGVVHTTRDPLAGEAWLGGPVVLSHADLAQTEDAIDRGDGYNVVIHEFAHKLDMLNGEANGYPPLHRGMSKETWKRSFLAAYLGFCKQVDEADAIARKDRGRALDALPIDPYAAENPAEFRALLAAFAGLDPTADLATTLAPYKSNAAMRATWDGLLDSFAHYLLVEELRPDDTLVWTGAPDDPTLLGALLTGARVEFSSPA